MNYLVLDVETNGLGKKARICSISWNIYNSVSNELPNARESYLIQPEKDFIMGKEAQKIHKISIDMMKNEGKEITYVLNKLKKEIRERGIKSIVAHNLIFDERVINYECKLHNIENIFSNVKKSCTMLISYELLKLNKWPKLNELYTSIFDKQLDINKLHNSAYDVEICAEIFFALKKISKQLR